MKGLSAKLICFLSLQNLINLLLTPLPLSLFFSELDCFYYRTRILYPKWVGLSTFFRGRGVVESGLDWGWIGVDRGGVWWWDGVENLA